MYSIELKEKIKKILEKKQPRYIFEATQPKELIEEIKNVTSFLEEDHRLQERLYCIMNDIIEHQKCINCRKHIHRFKSYFEDIKIYLSHSCSTTCAMNFIKSKSIFLPIDNSQILSLEELKLILKKSILNYDFKVINSAKFYLNELGIDYTKFNLQQSYKFILDDLKEIPKCPVCGKEVNYNSCGKWETYCSSKCSANSNETKEKRKNIVREKYNVDNVFQLEKTKEIIFKKQMIKKFKNLDKFKNLVIPLFSPDDFKKSTPLINYKWKCVKCNNEFYSSYYQNPPRCKKCFPLLCGISKNEKEVVDYIKKILKETIIENSYSIIPPRQLDIYIPSKNLAIEYDGLYWHSHSQLCDENYHLNKTLECEKKGIQLIHIFEDEWLNKRQIVKNRLKHILGLTKYKIYARKCEIREIDNGLKDKFLEKYHIQGVDKSRIKLGAFYKNRLVAVMTFAKSRFKKNDGMELVRFCTIGQFKVVGIGSKMFNYFIKVYRPDKVVSYADRRWSIGNFYRQLGFKFDYFSIPNYWYVKNGIFSRLSRQMFQKHKLKTIFKDKFNESKTEFENMVEFGFDRIYDVGNYVFSFINK